MKNFTKRQLGELVSRKIKHAVHKLHIFSIINILVEEIIRDLKDGKSIKIGNFGTFQLTILKPKRIVAVNTKKIKFVGKTTALRLFLHKKLRDILAKKSVEDLKKEVIICEDNQDQGQ